MPKVGQKLLEMDSSPVCLEAELSFPCQSLLNGNQLFPPA